MVKGSRCRVLRLLIPSQTTLNLLSSARPSISGTLPMMIAGGINPGLASHGGVVELTEITDDGFLVLKFGGGCQGCSAVDMTLKQGVEKTLMEKLPDVKGVRDVTDHTDTSNAYYS